MKPLPTIVGAVAIVAAGIGAYLWTTGGTTEQSDVPIGGPFELTSETGERVTEADYAGRYLLMYFGYTYCPDICPTGLATMSAAYDALPVAVRDNLQLIFVTVDPERDTVEVVRDYTELFHPDLIGLTGSIEDIEAAKSTFRVYAKKAGDDPQDYLVDHATFTYLIGPNTRYVTHFNHDATAEEMAKTIVEKTG